MKVRSNSDRRARRGRTSGHSKATERELIERMEKSLHRMPRLTRDIFLAHRLRDMPYPQIAHRTGLSVGEVERHIARAIVILARDLDEQWPWWKFW